MNHNYLKLSVLNVTRVVLLALVDIICCYLAGVNIKRDCLICVHVTSDKCNVSPGKQVKNCFPPRWTATYINKQNGGTISKIKNYTIFQVCVQIKNVKEKKNIQQKKKKR